MTQTTNNEIDSEYFDWQIEKKKQPTPFYLKTTDTMKRLKQKLKIILPFPCKDSSTS